MPVKIERLTCSVSVKTGRKPPALHGSPAPPKPSMPFALPSAQPRSEAAQPSPGQATAGENGAVGNGPQGNAAPAPARGADARAVSDRVYELMTQEIALAKQRGRGDRRR